MKSVGIKFACLHADGRISTWHDAFNTTVEDIIRRVMHDKNWMGGTFMEIYLEFDNNGQYYKVHLDIINCKFNQLLGT